MDYDLPAAGWSDATVVAAVLLAVFLTFLACLLAGALTTARGQKKPQDVGEPCFQLPGRDEMIRRFVDAETAAGAAKCEREEYAATLDSDQWTADERGRIRFNTIKPKPKPEVTSKHGVVRAPKEFADTVADLLAIIDSIESKLGARIAETYQRIVHCDGALVVHDGALTKTAQFSADIEARYDAHNARLAKLERLVAEHNQTIIHHRAVLRDLNEAAVDKIVDDVVMHRRRPITKRKRKR